MRQLNKHPGTSIASRHPYGDRSTSYIQSKASPLSLDCLSIRAHSTYPIAERRRLLESKMPMSVGLILITEWASQVDY